MQTVLIGSKHVSRLSVGGNPFSGFSHQGPLRDREMKEFYTDEKIFGVLRAAEAEGINTLFARVDEHMLGVVERYRDAGGGMQWFAQVSGYTDENPQEWKKLIGEAASRGADALYMHGGVVDSWYSRGLFSVFSEALDRMRATGLAAGFAGHLPEAHEWIRDNLEPDFHMCSHYNPTDRSLSPQYRSSGEKWDDRDRARMLGVINTIGKPAVHYKIFAGGNKPVLQACRLLGKHLREGDAACIGMYVKDSPGMVSENAALFRKHVLSRPANRTKQGGGQA